MNKQKNFFKIPKNLLHDETFKNLKPTSRIIIFYLLSCTNSFKSMIFWQNPVSFAKITGLSRQSIWRSKKELSSLGIIISQCNKKLQFNMVFFCDRYIKINEDRNNLESNIVTKSYAHIK